MAFGQCTITNKTLTAADTEYNVDITGAKRVSFNCRTATEIRFAFVTGLVATPTGAYRVLPAGSQWSDDYMINNQAKLYLASDVAGVVVEVEQWD
jgi:hypothetical protein